MDYAEHTVEPEPERRPRRTLVLHYADGTSSEPIDYDAVIAPPGYLKILRGDHVEAIHESLLDRFELTNFPADQFSSLE